MAIAVLGAVAVPAYGQKPELGMLDQLDHGEWVLRERGDGGTTHRLCVDNGRKLIQLRHPGLACNRVVVVDAPNQVTVQYTCRGRGYGRTHIRRETNDLIQIDSQGIVDGLPFSFAAEGRRVGDCR
ncbi:hypothetical protein [Novosphingobium mangrovi (ex Huang et al. 2023)]|uniref:DUF3617 domain-containing protein n=1 Tax=Novosphingobium mangrovi (ex Huang et al. 2023) TaxID=2976432 RepID=A0ABT2I307_9SPHN|nr:hypothetical protein [Novosphingobium mangrovi (ex Huang et al. 2023)]MCT2399191.1 hypothetical protein [Novosphingobium mangrovi (ex Huang et al. 2023)]